MISELIFCLPIKMGKLVLDRTVILSEEFLLESRVENGSRGSVFRVSHGDQLIDFLLVLAEGKSERLKEPYRIKKSFKNHRFGSFKA